MGKGGNMKEEEIIVGNNVVCFPAKKEVLVNPLVKMPRPDLSYGDPRHHKKIKYVFDGLLSAPYGAELIYKKGKKDWNDKLLIPILETNVPVMAFLHSLGIVGEEGYLDIAINNMFGEWFRVVYYGE